MFSMPTEALMSARLVELPPISPSCSHQVSSSFPPALIICDTGISSDMAYIMRTIHQRDLPTPINPFALMT